MKVTRKRVVLVEMDNVDYEMLLDTLGEASKVRSKLFPSLNEKAALLYGSITAAEAWAKGPTSQVLLSESERIAQTLGSGGDSSAKNE